MPAPRVSVPLIVLLPENVTALIPMAKVLPVMDKLSNVFCPEIVTDEEPVFVKDTLAKAKPPDANPELLPVKFICDVPALNVKFVIVEKSKEFDPVEAQLTVDPLKFIDRILLLLQKNAPNVCVKE